ncbi:hypothetical protein KR084_010321, partial [Drosophila pseudotakahashii]
MGKLLTGLLDTGASVSVLGKQCRELVDTLGVTVQPYFSVVRTASGEDRSIIGRVELPVRYKGGSKLIMFYLCPYLEQTAYFGVDFWRAFELAPAVVGKPGPRVVKAAEEIHASQMADQEDEDETKEEPESWSLSAEEKKALEKVKEEFLTFERDGLGTTNMEKHSIELIEGARVFKDRPYPMSPAKQKVVEDEIDKMLELGVIEESKSPWSNRTTVVSKPGKDRFCLDARKLNALTVKDAYPLPSIDGILSRIDQTHYISSVDLKFAFWQIELD